MVFEKTKGGAVNICAKDLFLTALGLEQAGKSGDLDMAREVFPRFDEEYRKPEFYLSVHGIL